MKIDVIDTKKNKVGDAELAPEIFEGEIKRHLVHDVVVNQMANHRKGTHKTKNRTEVRGGGKKPWKQKGLGRARAGSIRSPLFRGGGVVFGPTPRNYGYSVPKKVRKAALVSALTFKAQDNAFIVVDKLELAAPKTKDALAILNSLGISGKVLIVTGSRDSNLELSFRNIAGVKMVRPETVNTLDLVKADTVLCVRDALDGIHERLS